MKKEFNFKALEKKKTGKSLPIVLLLLLFVLLISCEEKQLPPEPMFGRIMFKEPETRDLSVSYETPDYDGLYWFYTAVKADSYGKTGETGENILAPVGSLTEKNLSAGLTSGEDGVGPFSLGKWTLKLVAYSDCTTSETGAGYSLPYPVTKSSDNSRSVYTIGQAEENKKNYLSESSLVYESDAINVTLTSTALTTVSASVQPKGKNGSVKFDNIAFESTNSYSSVVISRTDGTTEAVVKNISLDQPTENKNAAAEGDITATKEQKDTEHPTSYTYKINGTCELPEGMYKCGLKDTDSNPETVKYSFPFAVYPNSTTNVSWTDQNGD